MVEHLPHNLRMAGLNPIKCRAFSSSRSIFYFLLFSVSHLGIISFKGLQYFKIIELLFGGIDSGAIWSPGKTLIKVKLNCSLEITLAMIFSNPFLN